MRNSLFSSLFVFSWLTLTSLVHAIPIQSPAQDAVTTGSSRRLLARTSEKYLGLKYSPHAESMVDMVYEMESHSESMSDEDRAAGLAGILHDLGYPIRRASPQMTFTLLKTLAPEVDAMPNDEAYLCIKQFHGAVFGLNPADKDELEAELKDKAETVQKETTEILLTAKLQLVTFDYPTMLNLHEKMVHTLKVTLDYAPVRDWDYLTSMDILDHLADDVERSSHLPFIERLIRFGDARLVAGFVAQAE